MAVTTLDAYFAAAPDWRGDVMRALHGLVLESAPGAASAIKWAQPVYSLGGPMIFIKFAGKHVTFGFWRGAALTDPDGLLEGDGVRMKHLKLRSAELPRAQLQAWIHEAVRLNAAHGDPTKK
ncbi:MAG: DUF1801 domain-containing protein [Pseudomonadota bacterium]|nr:DUF1801 domain-containing protein [Pseudomonadota bacterium]